MINSMTAFARESDKTAQGNLVVEVRSVNHRYLDCTFKLPEAFRALEPTWRELLQKTLARGKLDCLLRWQGDTGGDSELKVNAQRLQQIARAREEVGNTLGDSAPFDFLAVLQFPGVLESGGDDEAALHPSATILFQRALVELQANRAREGGKLLEFISERLLAIQAEVDKTRLLMPELMAHQRKRIEQRLSDILTEGDPQRLEQEIVLLAQKSDVEEELDRLQAHVEEVARVLKKGGPCGRRLDFLMQELNREANTLSSKSISSSSTQNAVELKVLIEQMREQIQNLE